MAVVLIAKVEQHEMSVWNRLRCAHPLNAGLEKVFAQLAVLFEKKSLQYAVINRD